jgi:hypothetical protein
MEQNRSAGGVVPSVCPKLGRDESFDVFQENSGRSCSAYAVEDEGEEVSWVSVGSSFSGGGKWRAREAAR